MPSRRRIHSLGRSEKREWSWRSTRNIIAIGGGLEPALERGAQDLINLPPEERKLKIARMETEANQVGFAQAPVEIFVPDSRSQPPPAGPRTVAKRSGRLHLVET